MKSNVIRGIAALALAGGLIAFAPRPATAGEVSETIVNIQTPQGVKIWEPTSIFAKKGDTVKLKLVNKLTVDHGFEIEAYGIKEVVKPGATAEVSFTADKAGIFNIKCQLHAAHIAGQLVVLE